MNVSFDKGLAHLDLKNTGSTSSKTLYRIDSDFNSSLPPDIFFALETAKIFKADAVYFRHFSNGQPPISQIYIYDKTHSDINQAELDKIHRDLWSGHIVPMFIVIDKLRVRIFDSRSPIESDGLTYKSEPFEDFETASTAIEELEKAKMFSSDYIDNGTFWENEYGKSRFSEDKSVYYYFIKGLQEFRTKFNKEFASRFNNDLEFCKPITDKLLVLSILVKYLEERGDSDPERFAEQFFKKNFQVSNFSEAVRAGKLIDVFRKLNTKEAFNGRIFEWTDDEEAILQQADLSKLANFLDGDNDNGQYLIWRQYSFEYLPIELISNVYEEFLGKGKDVVYTPKFLVDLLINQTMSLDNPRQNFKIIDVSCGSGIFLVSAFKRLVEWWRVDNNNQIPEPAVLFQILRGQIFGIDIDEKAAQLSIFSLCLALCDKLTPRQIWQPLTFMDLSENNVLTNNFFNFLSKNKENEDCRFDLVIGNPPFNPPKGVKNSIYFNEIKAILPDVSKVPDDNLALLFLDQAMRLVKKDCQLCLILKSAPLLYNLSDGAIAFRKAFFERYNVNQVFDFSNLKKVLFGKVNVETLAIIATNQSPKLEEEVLHLTVRRTRSVEEKLFFELDYYDFHFIDKVEAIENTFIWKSNLFGGGRLSFLYRRLMGMKKLNDFILENKSELSCEEGFQIGKNAKRELAAHISDYKVIRAKSFTIDSYKLSTLKENELFKLAKTKELFSSCNLLIRKYIDRNAFIPNHLIDFYAPFDENLIGIHSNVNNPTKLKIVKTYFDRFGKTYGFYCFCRDSQFFLGATTSIRKKDILDLPMPPNMEDLELNYAETILRDDVLNYRIEQLYKGEAAKINALTTAEQLTEFGEVYCLALNSWHSEDSRRFYFSKVWETPSVFVTEFRLSNKVLTLEKEERKESNIQSILNFKDTDRNFNIQRIIRHYTPHAIYLVKPKQLRYWLKSIALRDADESINDSIVLEK